MSSRHDHSPACTSGWTGTSKCHCAACGENFSVVSNFDKHFDRKTGACLAPASVGLRLNQHGVWIKDEPSAWYDNGGKE